MKKEKKHKEEDSFKIRHLISVINSKHILLHLVLPVTTDSWETLDKEEGAEYKNINIVLNFYLPHKQSWVCDNIQF